MSNSQPKLRPQQTSQEASDAKNMVKPECMHRERSVGAVRSSGETSETESLMEQVVARANMLAALRRVKSNKGAPGSDGMDRGWNWRGYLKTNWPRIKAELPSRDAYRPQAVRRVEIPKPDGGIRLLGIPSVVDRLVQQALLQVFTPIFDPTFSTFSFGFRPGRSAHDAVKLAFVTTSKLGRMGSWISTWRSSSIKSIHDRLMARIWRLVKRQARLCT